MSYKTYRWKKKKRWKNVHIPNLDNAVPVVALRGQHPHSFPWQQLANICTHISMPSNIHSFLNVRHICQACIYIICRARKVKTPPHVLHWPTLFKPVDTFQLIMLHDQHWQYFFPCWLASCFIIAYCSWPCYGTPSLVTFSMSCRGPHQTWTENGPGHHPLTSPSPYKEDHTNTVWPIIKHSVTHHKTHCDPS